MTLTANGLIHYPPCGSYMEGPILKLNSDVKTDNAMVITCFPTVGMVSSIVGHYLIDHLDLEYVGGVVDPRLPSISLIQNGIPLPPIRAYAGEPKCTLEGCTQIILLLSELVVPEQLVHEIVWALFEWSKEKKIKAGVVIDAFARAGMKGNLNGAEPIVDYDDTEGIDLVGIGANEEMRNKLVEMGIPLLEQGVIKGINAAILSEAHRRGLGLMSIMVEADTRIPDARAAAVLIETLNELLPAIELDHAPLLEEAEQLEAQLKLMMEGAATALSEGQGSPNSMLYG